MSDVMFSSDTHYGHANVIKYAKRPYEDVDEMNEAMITNWNSVVRKGTAVYHLGDFALCDVDKATKIAKRLNGQKFLIFGNHDKRLRKEKEFLSQWVWAKDMADITVGSQRIVLCHYAMRVWSQSHRGAWQLYGHSHGSLKDDPRSLSLDVGVDCHQYYPISFEEVQVLMSKKTWKPIDHHGREDS